MRKLEEWETEEEMEQELNAIEDKIKAEIDKENQQKLSPKTLERIRKLNHELGLEGA